MGDDVMVLTLTRETRTGSERVGVSLPLVPFLLRHCPDKYALPGPPPPPPKPKQPQPPRPQAPRGSADRAGAWAGADAERDLRAAAPGDKQGGDRKTGRRP
jgi:hypothetical protein